jgi:RNA polymerase sigma-70 factor (ECF subfamily)
VTAGRHVTVMECDLLSPPWDPDHCPPGVVWLMPVRNGRISEIRLLHPSLPS